MIALVEDKKMSTSKVVINSYTSNIIKLRRVIGRLLAATTIKKSEIEALIISIHTFVALKWRYINSVGGKVESLNCNC
jgi:hypothetical protein